MDFHKLEHVTIEDIKAAHIADTSIQEKYGVRYHQFWVNEKTGMVFCLMEGPDQATCELVHKLAHGNIACSITEVEPAFYMTLMGKNKRQYPELTKQANDTFDLGYRNFLAVSLQVIADTKNCKNLNQLAVPLWAIETVTNNFNIFQGQLVNWPSDDSLIAVFHEAIDAVHCALSIQELLEKNEEQPKVISKIGLSATRMINKETDQLKGTIQLAHHLSNACQNNQIFIDHLVRKLCNGHIRLNTPNVKCMESSEEHFLSQVFNIAESHLSDHAFTITRLCKSIGVSRPQLYRKIINITGKSPNYFLRDIRLERAHSLLKQKAGNVAQVANEVGYSNPSYFSKCFAEKYGINPSSMPH